MAAVEQPEPLVLGQDALQPARTAAANRTYYYEIDYVRVTMEP